MADEKNEHLLSSAWSLWYDSGKPRGKTFGSISQKEWMATLKEVCSFTSVEQFWAIFNNLLPANRMQTGSSYYLFKKGIRPEWEDKANEKGGRWHFVLTKDEKSIAGGVWLYLVLGLIGNETKGGDDIVGGAVSMREREFRVSVWVKNLISVYDQHKIGIHLKKVLKMDRKNLFFRTHESDKKRDNVNQMTV
ncbi:hypothetical protein MHBO_002919 [Bonamia ostreae]|uniref:Eukaryotic translation initiation factor 4E n=1 Tax=Bonamia ostreae TaxID=126728 RepID=A0ABV2ANY5_9EUKA